jgi:hypothetical protein
MSTSGKGGTMARVNIGTITVNGKKYFVSRRIGKSGRGESHYVRLGDRTITGRITQHYDPEHVTFRALGIGRNFELLGQHAYVVTPLKPRLSVEDENAESFTMSHDVLR